MLEIAFFAFLIGFYATSFYLAKHWSEWFPPDDDDHPERSGAG